MQAPTQINPLVGTTSYFWSIVSLVIELKSRTNDAWYDPVGSVYQRKRVEERAGNQVECFNDSGEHKEVRTRDICVRQMNAPLIPPSRLQADMPEGYLKHSWNMAIDMSLKRIHSIERKVNMGETIRTLDQLQLRKQYLRVPHDYKNWLVPCKCGDLCYDEQRRDTRIYQEETHTVDAVITHRSLLHKQVGK
ncbi:hypothetical protein K435DRAFT_803204 [Dendrothele bispora CBS 962.96]|uniref:Uncharacterized protein n=1 Tax=Dendrothele bispora (strain CBS 962.96) TaxID=1314807 RepID=A0A4S8LIE8_DENBC|nr:hypothetical protein K435DRAFT_803204 [Dendrothele bispora CBS 962.96]